MFALSRLISLGILEQMDNVNDDEGWDRVASWVHQQIDKRPLRQVEKESHVGYSTIKKLLAGEPVVRGDALKRLSEYFGYRSDAIDRVRQQREPVRLETVSDIPAELERWMASINQRLNEISQDLADIRSRDIGDPKHE